MQPPTFHQQGRINLTNLKSQIAKQLGPDRTQMYFTFLSRLIAQKLSKTEFNKFCIIILGRENIPLHNKLIRSILRNAYHAKSPPPLGDKSVLKQTGVFLKKSPKGNEHLTKPSFIQCNGDALLPSPRKRRTGVSDRKSPLGSNGRIDETSKNGILGACDWKRPVHNHLTGPAEQPATMPHTENSWVSMEGGENVEKMGELNSIRSLQAPLGVPLCPLNAGGARKSLPSASSSTCGSSNYDAGELCHTECLRKWMEKIAEAQGMGVTLDCANLLNNSLDVYLKRLIKSTLELSRASPTKNPIFKQQVHEKPLNGIWLGNQMHVQSSNEASGTGYGHRNHCTVSLRDFQVAMELNPQQLGEDWPLMFEKICIRSSES
ncbi:hypothetical protein KSP40_PGU013298 [Platanthera guangdongensis]|uniref:Transcriptional coactivator Hfi1/Transcriptional adapter 1 n=1 Tax=Platanthera guangdongensis TaxID=2320717 RepID=A0ABR2LF39_9ASPA